MLIAFLFFALDCFPLSQDAVGVANFLLAEDMRMSPNEFHGHFANDVVDLETIFFGGDLRVHDDDQQQIAEFFAKVFIVTRPQGTSDFINFFDQRRQERFVSLFAIPRAAVGRAELRDDVAELLKFLAA